MRMGFIPETKCLVIFLISSAHSPLFLLSLLPLSFLSSSNARYRPVCPPRRLCTAGHAWLWGPEPHWHPSQSVAWPPWRCSSGWRRTLATGATPSSDWWARTLGFNLTGGFSAVKEFTGAFCPSWVSPSAVCSCQSLVLHSWPRGRLEMLTHTLQTKTGLLLCLRY